MTLRLASFRILHYTEGTYIRREGKARRKRRSSSGKGNGTVEEPYLSESEISTDSDNDEKGPSKRYKPLSPNQH